MDSFMMLNKLMHNWMKIMMLFFKYTSDDMGNIGRLYRQYINSYISMNLHEPIIKVSLIYTFCHRKLLQKSNQLSCGYMCDIFFTPTCSTCSTTHNNCQTVTLHA